MKKTLLLFFAALIFACTFAISSSASMIKAESDEFGEVTVVEGLPTKSTDLTAKVVLKNEDNTFSTYYTYYIYPKFNWRGGMSAPDFKGLNEALGTSYDNSSIIRIELLSDCKYIELPSECNTYLKEMLIPEDINTTTLYRTYFKALEKINIPSKITSISANTFDGTSTLKYVTFGEDFAMTSLPNAMFSGCSSLEEIKLPNSVTSIGVSFFANCTSLKRIYLGESLDISGNSMIVGVTTAKIYASSKWFSTNAPVSNSFAYAGHTPTDITLYYVGTKQEAEALKAKSNHNGIKNAELVEYDPTKSDDYYVKSEQKAWTIVYGYNKCKAFYNGEHLNDNSPCVINCDRCKTYGLEKENAVHSISTTIEYESYDKAGAKIVYCKNDGCVHRISEVRAPLFNCLGYSSPESGESGIAIGFVVNNEAIAEYENMTGQKIKYGVFVALKDKLGNNSVFSEDGVASEGVLSLEISSVSFVMFELRVMGFATDEQKSAKLAMGAYVVTTSDETTEYSYLQDESSGERFGDYYFASYSDIVENK